MQRFAQWGWRRLSTRRQLLLLSFIVCSLMVIIGSVGLWGMEQNRQNVDDATGHAHSLTLLQQMEADLSLAQLHVFQAFHAPTLF